MLVFQYLANFLARSQKASTTGSTASSQVMLLCSPCVCFLRFSQISGAYLQQARDFAAHENAPRPYGCMHVLQCMRMCMRVCMHVHVHGHEPRINFKNICTCVSHVVVDASCRFANRTKLRAFLFGFAACWPWQYATHVFEKQSIVFRTSRCKHPWGCNM